ncbi:hypothetical protein R3P38DRAFT_3261116 [Favolaschia claudopus]|uniref:Uncharacterized protein n=1 Tax=Favolaschia claudopus TaxID=2862362 RepID=A0AAW0CN11_9AGAR
MALPAAPYTSRLTGENLLSRPLPPELQKTIMNEGYLLLGEAAYTTTKTPEPTVFLYKDEDELKHLITGDAVLQVILLQPQTEIKVEPGQVLLTEADVERAAHLYLIHNINLIFQAYLDELFPGQNKRIVLNGQLTIGPARTDLTWSIDKIIILAMEVKNWSVQVLYLNCRQNTFLIYDSSRALAKKDWTPFTFHLPPKARTLLQRVKDIKAETIVLNQKYKNYDAADPTNRLVLSRQGAKYNRTHCAPVVLLFDWLNMILLDFEPDTAPEFKPHRNEWQYSNEFAPVEILFAQDKEPFWTTRRTLLTALLLGYKKCFTENGTRRDTRMAQRPRGFRLGVDIEDYDDEEIEEEEEEEEENEVHDEEEEELVEGEGGEDGN